jgi:hypothetical protein
LGSGGDCDSDSSDDESSAGGDACHGKGCDHDSPRHPIRPPHRFKQILNSVRRLIKKWINF